ncbi:hypothetical protein [Paractinoplanes toevensis]|uniref:Uncharacterized protein n=1 Tax=Paractinoplanes toevensis TaxID=571911 RepID=A0A919T6Q3_9ACTN|nr:hypothetical protein [Actinoplanes toevensis]GIM88754.1 hypothetical protein Ato02nite_005470 [Actinoplanes toevensis]
MPLTSRLTLAVTASQTAALDLGTAVANVAKSYTADLANGTAAGQADKIFHDTRTLAASANEDLDLAGVLTDALGGALTFVRIKALIIAAAAGNTNNVIVGGAASNGFITWVGAATHTIAVRPGAVLSLVAGAADATGYVVTAATGDLLRVANSSSGSTVTYDIIVVGCSA